MNASSQFDQYSLCQIVHKLNFDPSSLRNKLTWFNNSLLRCILNFYPHWLMITNFIKKFKRNNAWRKRLKNHADELILANVIEGKMNTTGFFILQILLWTSWNCGIVYENDSQQIWRYSSQDSVALAWDAMDPSKPQALGCIQSRHQMILSEAKECRKLVWILPDTDWSVRVPLPPCWPRHGTCVVTKNGVRTWTATNLALWSY